MRDRISQINRLLKKQKVVLSESTDKDVINYALTNEKICFAVLQFSKGVLTGTDTFILDYTGELNEMFSEFLLSFYTQNHIPEKILFCEDFSFDEALGEYLSEQKGKRVALSNPKRGENLSLLEMTKQNAVQKLAYYIGQKGSQVRALEDLKDALNLKKIPNYIESYDISHTAGSDPVCSMVVFKNGVPFKKAYRTFLIKEAIGGDDLGSLKEAVKRRFNEYEKNKGSENTFAILPDLILLDGGQNQVNAVLPVIEEFNVDVPLFGIVKDSKHRTRAIQSTGSEISITDAKGDSRAMFSLVSEIGEEVHRFAISIHRKRHQKSQIQTVLTSINGIGEKKSKALINRFHSVKKISLASIEELASTDGISQKDATKIFEYFKTDT